MDDRETYDKVNRATEDMISMRDPDHRTRQQRRFQERKGERTPDRVAVAAGLKNYAARSVSFAGDRDDPTDAAAWGGKLNIYVCDRCHSHIVTRDVAEGVAPFMLPAATYCPNQCWPERVMMISSMYRVWNQSMREDYQWYAPDDAQRAAATPYQRHHYENGGLEIRKAVFDGD